MTIPNFDSILKTIADQHGTTPEEVRTGIHEAIMAGMNNSDSKFCGLWREMGDGTMPPEPEDAILFLSTLAAIRFLTAPTRSTSCNS